MGRVKCGGLTCLIAGLMKDNLNVENSTSLAFDGVLSKVQGRLPNFLLGLDVDEPAYAVIVGNFALLHPAHLEFMLKVAICHFTIC